MSLNWSIRNMLIALSVVCVVFFGLVVSATSYTNARLVDNQNHLVDMVIPLEVAVDNLRDTVFNILNRQHTTMDAGSTQPLNSPVLPDQTGEQFKNELSKIASLKTGLPQLAEIFKRLQGTSQAFLAADDKLETSEEKILALQKNLDSQIMEMDRLIESDDIRNANQEIRYGIVRLAMYGHKIPGADTLDALNSLHENQIRQSVQLAKNSLASMEGKLAEGKNALNSNIDKIVAIAMGGDDSLLVLQQKILQQKETLLQDKTSAAAVTKEMMVELDNLSRLSIDIREKSISKSGNIVSANQNILLPLGIAMVVFILFSSVYATRRLIRRILRLTQMLDSLGEGKITQRLTLSARHDELDMIGKGINSMAERLFGILGKVSDATQELNQSFLEMSAAIEEQAIVSSDQAAAVTEITATMEELSISSSQIAQHSKRVLDMSTKALDETTQGAVGVEMIMGKMVEITDENRKSTQEIIQVGKKSKDIVKVMNIINNIADQTKLIAFNAALEASSAGDAGRRFGVVAVEIRRLADTVMESIREIEVHINENQEAINNLVIRSEEGAKRVEEGMELATKTAEMLIGIVDDVRSTSEASKQISLSTQQQKTASDQVLISLKEIGHGTRQSSASIGQISTIVKGLNRMSGNLICELNKFELKAQEEKRQPLTGEPVQEHTPYGTTPSIA